VLKNKKVIWAIIAAVATLLLLVAYVTFTKETKMVGKVLTLSGLVEVMKDGSDELVKVFPNMQFTQGDLIQTGEDGRAGLMLDENKEIEIAPDTRLAFNELVKTFNANKGKSYLYLHEGKVKIKISEKLDGDSRFNIETPNAIMGVMGTEFYVYYDGKGTWVGVIEGQVEAIAGDDRTILVPNNRSVYIYDDGTIEEFDLTNEEQQEMIRLFSEYGIKNDEITTQIDVDDYREDEQDEGEATDQLINDEEANNTNVAADTNISTFINQFVARPATSLPVTQVATPGGNGVGVQPAQPTPTNTTPQPINNNDNTSSNSGETSTIDNGTPEQPGTPNFAPDEPDLPVNNSISCSDGTIFDNETQSCVAVIQPTPDPITTTNPEIIQVPGCGGGTVLNTVTAECEPIVVQQPPTATVCEGNTQLNVQTNNCDPIAPEAPVCTSGTQLNQETNNCEAIVPEVPVCTGNTQLNLQTNSCVEIVPDPPVCEANEQLNVETNECETIGTNPVVCEGETQLNEETNECEEIVPVCLSGATLQNVQGEEVCALAWQYECPPGMTLNDSFAYELCESELLPLCEEDDVPGCVDNYEEQCPEGEHNEANTLCLASLVGERCPDGFRADDELFLCIQIEDDEDDVWNYGLVALFAIRRKSNTKGKQTNTTEANFCRK
jgi:hypothetical protein